MEQQDKNRWLNEVMNSLEGMQPAHADGRLFEKIEQQLDVRRTNNGAKVIPLRTVSFAAACILLLIAINCFTLVKKRRIQQHKGLQEVAEYYQLNNVNPLYDL